MAADTDMLAMDVDEAGVDDRAGADGTDNNSAGDAALSASGPLDAPATLATLAGPPHPVVAGASPRCEQRGPELPLAAAHADARACDSEYAPVDATARARRGPPVAAARGPHSGQGTGDDEEKDDHDASAAAARTRRAAVGHSAICPLHTLRPLSSSAPTHVAPPSPASPLARVLLSVSQCSPSIAQPTANNSEPAADAADGHVVAAASAISVLLLPPPATTRAQPPPLLAPPATSRPRPIKLPKSYAARRATISPYPASAPTFSMAPPDRGERFTAHSPAATVPTAAFPDAPAFSSPPTKPQPLARPPSLSSLKSPSGPLSTANRQRPPAFPSVPRRRVSPPELMSPTTPAALRVARTPHTPAFYRQGFTAAPRRAPHPAARHPYAAAGHAARSAPSLEHPQLQPGPPARRVPPPPGVDAALLDSIPREYVIRRLNEMAWRYWTAPQTTDCTLHDDAARTPATAQSAYSVHSNMPARSRWPPTPVAPAGVASVGTGLVNPVNPGRDGSGRRGSAPSSEEVPALAFPVHRDYLVTQSTLLRKILCNDDVAPHSPTLRGARLVPSPEGERAVVYLPLPDLASFGVIVHYLYWGDADALEGSLSRGLVTWQGVVKNIEYLDLDDRIKRVVGKWWRRWIRPSAGRAGAAAAHRVDDDDDDDDAQAYPDAYALSSDSDGPGAEGDDEMETRSSLTDDRDDDVSARMGLL